jgi:hypothetical protein
MMKEKYLLAAALPNDSSGGDDDSDILMATGYNLSSSSSIQEKKSYDEASQEDEEDIPAHICLAWLPVQYPDILSYDEMDSFRIRSDDPALHKPSESHFPRGDAEELLDLVVVSLDY